MDNELADKARELCSRAQELEREGDLDMAAQLYEQAAELGSGEGAYKTGLVYKCGFVVERDPAETFKWFRRAAEAGYAESFAEVATLYELGLGVGQNWQEAAKWHLKAAEQGCSASMESLGYIYDRGLGVAKDEKKAAEWCRKAINKERYDEFPEACRVLGYMILRGVIEPVDPNESFHCLYLVAQDGMERAQDLLGDLYYYGNGVEQDHSEAVKWFRRSAEQGYARAQNDLGWMYELKQDYSEAVKWYRKAAEQGYAYAQKNLGDMYEHGYGVTKDRSEARKWYQRAAEQGNEVAKQNLKNL